MLHGFDCICDFISGLSLPGGRGSKDFLLLRPADVGHHTKKQSKKKVKEKTE